GRRSSRHAHHQEQPGPALPGPEAVRPRRAAIPRGGRGFPPQARGDAPGHAGANAQSRPLSRGESRGRAWRALSPQTSGSGDEATRPSAERDSTAVAFRTSRPDTTGGLVDLGQAPWRAPGAGRQPAQHVSEVEEGIDTDEPVPRQNRIPKWRGARIGGNNP